MKVVISKNNKEDKITITPESKADREELEKLCPPFDDIIMGWTVYNDTLEIVCHRS